jgi:hypothetical protein
MTEGGAEMRRSKIGQLLPMLVLIAGALILFGCRGDSCSTDNHQLPAEWAEIKFPLLDNASLCVYSGKQVSIKYTGTELVDLVSRYTERFKSEGWEVTPLNRSSMSFDASKDKKARFTLQFMECNKSLTSPGTWSKCTEVSVIKR